MTENGLRCRLCGTSERADPEADVVTCGRCVQGLVNAHERKRLDRVAKGTQRCQFHRSYRGKTPPKNECRTCWGIYDGTEV